MTPLKAEYIGADQLPFFIFRLQRRGGPYIPVIPVVSMGDYFRVRHAPAQPAPSTVKIAMIA